MMPKAPILLMAPLALFAHNLMPVPAKLQPGAGRLRIDRNFAFVQLNGYREPRLEAAAARLVEQVARKTGIPMAPGIGVHAPEAPLVVYCDHASAPVQSAQEDESYRLTVTPLGARLDAPNPLGVLRGMQTFLQLVDLDASGFGVPAVTIEDHPRFPVARPDAGCGAPLDSARGREAHARRHGRGEVERVPLAPVGEPGLPHRKQAFPEAAGNGLRWPVLHAGPGARGHRLRARAGHSRDSGIRHARPRHRLVRGLSGIGERARTVPDRAEVGRLRSGHGSHAR